MDLMANVLLAIGASPAMVHSLEEVEDFMKLAAGLLVGKGCCACNALCCLYNTMHPFIAHCTNTRFRLRELGIR